MAEVILPLFLDGCQRITDVVGYERRDGMIYYFHGMLPIFSHGEDDRASFKMFTSQLISNGECQNVDIQKAFGITKNSVCRALKKFRTEGCAAFYEKKATRGAVVLTADVLAEAQRLLDSGLSRASTADQLSIKRDTLRKAINTGLLHESEKKGP